MIKAFSCFFFAQAVFSLCRNQIVHMPSYEKTSVRVLQSWQVAKFGLGFWSKSETQKIFFGPDPPPSLCGKFYAWCRFDQKKSSKLALGLKKFQGHPRPLFGKFDVWCRSDPKNKYIKISRLKSGTFLQIWHVFCSHFSLDVLFCGQFLDQKWQTDMCLHC